MSCHIDGPRTATACTPCSPGIRNRYFRGKLLTVADYEAEQRYAIQRRRLINRQMLGWGVSPASHHPGRGRDRRPQRRDRRRRRLRSDAAGSWSPASGSSCASRTDMIWLTQGRCGLEPGAPPKEPVQTLPARPDAAAAAPAAATGGAGGAGQAGRRRHPLSALRPLCRAADRPRRAQGRLRRSGLRGQSYLRDRGLFVDRDGGLPAGGSPPAPPRLDAGPRRAPTSINGNRPEDGARRSPLWRSRPAPVARGWSMIGPKAACAAARPRSIGPRRLCLRSRGGRSPRLRDDRLSLRRSLCRRASWIRSARGGSPGPTTCCST